MKNMFICLKISKIYFSIIILILIILVCLIGRKWCHSMKKSEMNNTTTLIENSEKDNEIPLMENSDNDNMDEMKEKIDVSNSEVISKNTEVNAITQEKTTKLEEYKTMPREISGHKVIGKIQISKINLEAYILAETNNNALKVSVTKLCGPEINGIGNFCIAGHNYNKFFAKIKNLKIKDNIILTDTYDHSVIYEVYDTFQTSPQDISCLNQDTKGEKELTLITCTKGATKRVIVKAVEVYD